MRLAPLALVASCGRSSASARFSPGEPEWCGGETLYIFWDEKCGAGSYDPYPAAWIISSRKPDPTRQGDLIAGAGYCDNLAFSASDSHELSGAQAASWGSKTGCCARSAGELYDATIEEVDQDGSIKVSGLCEVEGGRDWLNQVYNVSGNTTGGRRWYTSSSRGYEYQGVHVGGTDLPVTLIMGIAAGVVACVIGIVLLWFVKSRRRARHAQLGAMLGIHRGGGGWVPGRRKPAVGEPYAAPPAAPAVNYGGQHGQYASGQYGGQDYG